MTEMFSAVLNNRRLSDALKSFTKTSEWMHIVSGIGALCAFITDLLEPRFPHCTLWAFLAVMFVMAAIWVFAKSDRLSREKRDAALSFLIVPAGVLFVLLISKAVLGNPGEGAIAKLVPGVQKIQKDLGIAQLQMQKQIKHTEEAVKALHREFTIQQKQIIKEIHAIKDVPESVLEAALAARLDKLALPNDTGTVRGMLQALADQYKQLEYDLSKDTNGAPQARALLAKAEADFASGNFDGARLKMHQAAEIDRDLSIDLNRRAIESTVAAANALEHSARLAELAGRHREAAEDFSEAAKLLKDIDPHRAWLLTREEGGALHRQGTESHDASAAKQAVVVYQTALTLAPRARNEAEWQTSRTELGAAMASFNLVVGGATGPGGRSQHTAGASVEKLRWDGNAYGRNPVRHRGRDVSRVREAPARPAPLPVTASPPEESRGFFSRLKDWAARNTARGADRTDTSGPRNNNLRRFERPKSQPNPIDRRWTNTTGSKRRHGPRE